MMKSLILSTILLFSSFSSTGHLSPLLNLYLDIKDALVSSDAATATAKAAEFAKAVNAVDVNSLTADEQAAFKPLQQKLSVDADLIAKAGDLAGQRAAFKAFSDHVYALSKAVKLSDEPVYQQYCPMKKSYWLSKDAAIKNPYYGKQMLTCGKVSDTL
jgi:hypothetical protein